MLGDEKEPYDVVVAGAGPGGSACAGYLGRMGALVLLLDKAQFPRDKTCGDAVSGKSMRVMRDFGLMGRLKEAPHGEISGVHISSPQGKTVTIPFSKNDANREGGKGFCIRRQNTDFILFNAAKQTPGVAVKEKFMVTGVLKNSAGKAIGVSGIDLASGARAEKSYYAKVVVGADGVNSMVARGVLGDEGAKLDPKHSCDAVRVYYKGIKGLTGNIEIHFLDSCMPGYFWIFPLDGGYANVGLGILSEDLQRMMKKDGRSLVKIMNDSIGGDPMIKERFADAVPVGQVTGWRLPFGSKRRKIAGDGWVLVGDAASLVDPFSGEGVGNATTAGRLAAGVVKKALDSKDTGYAVLSEYEKKLWEAIGEELKTSYQMQRLGRWKWLLNAVIGKAAQKAELRELLSASLSNEEAKRNFRSPLFILKLILT